MAMCCHARCHDVSYLRFGKKKRENVSFSEAPEPAFLRFRKRGEGSVVPGMSTNHCDSLEPAPPESNWHFEINLCQEPSGSILQQSRVHSALTIRQLKI